MLTTPLKKCFNINMVAKYGSVYMIREKCPECGDTSFVINGKSACCNIPIKININKFQNMIQGNIRKGKPNKDIRKNLLEIQQNACAYCRHTFGTIYIRKNVTYRLKINWDHFVPYSFIQANDKLGWVAACNVCNNIKSNSIFASIEEVVKYVSKKIINKQITFVSEALPPMPTNILNDTHI